MQDIMVCTFILKPVLS